MLNVENWILLLNTSTYYLGSSIIYYQSIKYYCYVNTYVVLNIIKIYYVVRTMYHSSVR
jgi:hypothetical protein